ncbi:MAG: U32 family peptidase [Oscillospiraceae bacterium]|nr:U32 family peptidase [Oscillospiraceae bacterium]
MISARPELLAPAGSPEALTAALRCGADAVYLGAKQFSARANAENFDADGMKAAADACHLAGARLYLAVNTLIFDSEFSALDALLETAAAVGADGCIVQDLGAAVYMHRRLPTLRLHASTQLTIHTPAGVQLAKQAGFRRIVTARELSRGQLAAVCREAARCEIEVEAFVHGAHCMCVSGQCFMSAAMGGRSANRGCCAQPCRLPFSADDSRRGACALSLKDLSLVTHLSEMCEIGVHSLKIEGRMKRPEYVAAAVTACRDALDGRPPALDTLRAVFSRSGFTDGYFTGSRADMFGTRQKEDVTAAQTVLAPLRESYRKPRKTACLRAHYTLRADEPAALTVSDGLGHSVTVRGEIPQRAETRPTALPQLTQSFSKLGDTIYNAGEVTAETGDGLMLPAAALNAMRREAAAEMDACIIRANTPVHRLMPAPPLPAAWQTAPQPEFRLQIRRLGQLRELGSFADRIAWLLLPLPLAEEALAQSPFPASRCILLAPRFVCDEEKIAQMLENARALGYRHLGVQQPGDLALGRRLGFTLHGTLGMHAANSLACAALADLGLTDLLLSPELSRRELPASPVPAGIFAYGRLPLMLTRNCPVKAQVGCAKCRHMLTDRRGAAVYTDCTRCTEAPDYAELFNSAAVWLADRPEAYVRAGYALLAMTDETPERVREIAAAYLDGVPCSKPERYTRGLVLS